MNLRAILDGLEQNDRDDIFFHFEEGTSFYVEYEPGKVIGVNVDDPKVKITFKHEPWVLGEL